MPALETLSSLGFEERNPGCPGNFAGMSRTPGGVQKVRAKKLRAHFSFPIFCSLSSLKVGDGIRGTWWSRSPRGWRITGWFHMWPTQFKEAPGEMTHEYPRPGRASSKDPTILQHQRKGDNNNNSGKEKTHKHKQICGIVPGLGGCQKFVYVFFSGHSLGGEKTHKQNSPPKSRDNPVKILFTCFVFYVFFFAP